jgi:hypothetical protein
MKIVLRRILVLVLTLFPGGLITWFVLATPNMTLFKPITVGQLKGHRVPLVRLSDHTHLKVSTGHSFMVVLTGCLL